MDCIDRAHSSLQNRAHHRNLPSVATISGDVVLQVLTEVQIGAESRRYYNKTLLFL